MAFTIRKGAFGSGTTSCTIAVPTGGDAPVSGDLMVIVLESSDSTTAAGTPATPGGGWASIFEQTLGGGATGVTTLTVFAKLAGGSEADVSITGVGDHCAGSMFVVTGHGVATIPTDLVIGTHNAANSAAGAAPSITVTAGSLVVMMVGATRDAAGTNVLFSSWAATDPSSLTEIEDQTVSTASGGGVGYAHGVCAGTTTGTGTNVVGVSGNHQELFLGIKPASGATNLVIQDATHAHAGDNLALTQVHSLVVADATHAQAADNQALTQVHSIVVQDATHAHTADPLTLTQVHNLVIQDSTHGHTADNIALAGAGFLGIADGTHSHSADNIALTQVHTLQIQDSLHTQTADSLTLTGVFPVEEEGPGGGVFLGPGFLAARNRVKIRQTIPAFIQTLDAEVNDDELVLLLVL